MEAFTITQAHQSNTHTDEFPARWAILTGQDLPFGETDAGRVVAENLEKLHRATGQLEELQASQKTLAQKFDGKLFEEFKSKRDKLILKHQLQKAGRWIVRPGLWEGQ